MPPPFQTCLTNDTHAVEQTENQTAAVAGRRIKRPRSLARGRRASVRDPPVSIALKNRPAPLVLTLGVMAGGASSDGGRNHQTSALAATPLVAFDIRARQTPETRLKAFFSWTSAARARQRLVDRRSRASQIEPVLVAKAGVRPFRAIDWSPQADRQRCGRIAGRAKNTTHSAL